MFGVAGWAIFLLTSSHTTDNPCTANTSMYDRHNIAKLCFKCRVEVGATLNSTQTITVCQFGEYSDVTIVFELDA